MSGKQSVLLIEDSDTQALLFSDILENAGAFVSRVATAEQGLEHLRSRRPDLIIVDYHLPGLQGDEFCRLIRANGSTSAIPLLILTEDSESTAEQHGLNCGADDYVAKSCDPEVLLARVELVMRKSRAEVEPNAPFFRAQEILVVDDSPTYLLFMEEELKHEGYGVITSESGERALEAVARREFDCVVIDLVMPRMDGIELCRRLSEIRASTHAVLPILIVTSRGSKEKMMEALDVGADDFVDKANDTTVLKARIRALLRRKLLQDERQRVQKELSQKEVEIAQERAAKEAALERAKLATQLEAANKELEAFSYAVSHDLRAPLRSVDGFSQILLEDHGDKLDEDAKALIARVRGAAAKMSQLIEDLLKLSRVTNAALSLAEVDLSRMAREVVDALAQSEPDRKVEVAIAPGVTAQCDRALMQIVLTNLLGNAWKYTQKQPNPRIEFGRIETNSGVGFFVRDNGAGFDMALAAKLYQPFRRLHSESEFPGTGIGLATVSRVIRRHGGKIEADSRKGEGAVFAVTLGASLADGEPSDQTHH
jgi:two-component system NtrC family sensor kinase